MRIFLAIVLLANEYSAIVAKHIQFSRTVYLGTWPKRNVGVRYFCLFRQLLGRLGLSCSEGFPFVLGIKSTCPWQSMQPKDECFGLLIYVVTIKVVYRFSPST